ncbi:hypothetical protein [Chitinimonas sp. BJB300]|uniref:hypothetical protein n=1 Tax=Chitinimonas sp. BJB300 TaxID=1559339 RepID=UPI001112C61A|nr:hypothetical protein [Chitinimonas sp. BJB300]TSJ84460.1 hypothetical protein FG002_020145 [Chitinimonas sp. BJB300]
MENNLVNEVKEHRKRNNSPQLNVTPIVEKYIPKGVSWLDVNKELDAAGFKCTQSLSKATSKITDNYYCTLVTTSWYEFSVANQLRLNISVFDGKVSSAEGILVYFGF